MNQIVATITGQTFHYGILTSDDIYGFLDTVKENLIKPTHLFMTEEGAKDLSNSVWDQFHGANTTQAVPLLKMFMGMHVVVLPGLNEDTLIIGTLNLE